MDGGLLFVTSPDAFSGYTPDGKFTPLQATSADEFWAGLYRFVATGITFDRMAVYGHGGPGNIKFGQELIMPHNIRSNIGIGCHRLFPLPSKIYFGGCNVAETDFGWTFLQAVGACFLRIGGGEVLAYRTYGAQFFESGPIRHLTGGLRTMVFSPGGVEASRNDGDALLDIPRRATPRFRY
jgi:hypothetical protein